MGGRSPPCPSTRTALRPPSLLNWHRHARASVHALAVHPQAASLWRSIASFPSKGRTSRRNHQRQQANADNPQPAPWTLAAYYTKKRTRVTDARGEIRQDIAEPASWTAAAQVELALQVGAGNAARNNSCNWKWATGCLCDAQCSGSEACRMHNGWAEGTRPCAAWPGLVGDPRKTGRAHTVLGSVGLPVRGGGGANGCCSDTHMRLAVCSARKTVNACQLPRLGRLLEPRRIEALHVPQHAVDNAAHVGRRR